MRKLSLFFLILGCFWVTFSFGQSSHSENLKQLNQLIETKNTEQANKLLQQHYKSLINQKAYFLSTDLIYYYGKIQVQLQKQPEASRSVTLFAQQISQKTDSLKVLRQVALELGSYYEFIGDSQKAYQANEIALKNTKKWKEATPNDLALIEQNLAIFASRKGDFTKELQHQSNAKKLYEKYAKADKSGLYRLYNSLGATFWYASKMDSALYYYEKAAKTVAKLEKTPMNLYYRPATLLNNMSAIYSIQGNWDKGQKAMAACILNLQKFIKTDSDGVQKDSAKEFLFMAIENYAGFYKDIGNFEKAKELLMYAYREKKKHFDAENAELFKSKILLGQIYYDTKEFELAEQYLNEGIHHIQQTEGGNAYWLAEAHHASALLNLELNRVNVAKSHFAKAELFFQEALDQFYDRQYLDFVTKASLFYAQNQEKEKAFAMATKAYEYIKKNQGISTTFEMQHALNVGQIYFESENYQQALAQANIALSLLQNMQKATNSARNTARLMLFKPEALLLKAKANFYLQPTPSETFLKNTLTVIKQAITLVEQQKPFLDHENNTAILINNNAALIDFTKQIALALYEKTKQPIYLEELIVVHESVLYNKIRSQLQSKNLISYYKIPKTILEEEKQIHKEIHSALASNQNFESYELATKKWEMYVEKLKKQFPKYYSLRFQTISKPLKEITAAIPVNTSVIRYLYVKNDLYASVLTSKTIRLFKLNTINVVSDIEKLQSDVFLFQPDTKLFHSLYQRLWKPFEKEVTTEKVIIIPDMNLFNLNFELLTPKTNKNFKEFASHSLLANHSISYHYSLYLIGKQNKTTLYKDNFVAFAPEFNDKMKNKYRQNNKNSQVLDTSYLQLLPQPFIKELAIKSSKMFYGTSFLNENSTESSFKSKANQHKIIHIGTHAESNNVSPKFSKLLFAKQLDSQQLGDNQLYSYEIYNINLASNLTILSACETGKPTYASGEGMISLAHAFHYAGSESVLTSLSKIDEKSSAIIIESFLQYIKEGFPKDKALQRAKIEYIKNAKGRSVHPQYWAGLIIIGDTSPITFTNTTDWPAIVLLIGLFLLTILCVLKYKTES